MVFTRQPERPRGSVRGGRRAAWLARPTRRRILLACGVAAPVWWVAMDVVGSLRYAGYSYRDQTISELSAEGAPTRAFMTVQSGAPYTVLMVAFGVGVWAAADPRRAERITGGLLAGEAVFGFVGGLLFPMAKREVIAAGGETLRNTLHMPYGAGMSLFFLLAIGVGSELFGKRFRYLSYGSIVAMLVFGFLMGLQNGRLTANEPTPWMGVEERVNAYAAMLWVVALAIAFLRAEDNVAIDQGNRRAITRGGQLTRKVAVT